MALSILIVDDHDGFRALARAMLQAGGFEVVGEAADGEAAIEAAARLRPRVVLLDVQLPGLDGFAVCRRLTDGADRADVPAVILVSTRDASAYRQRLAATPARGFIAKADLTADAVAAFVA